MRNPGIQPHLLDEQAWNPFMLEWEEPNDPSLPSDDDLSNQALDECIRSQQFAHTAVIRANHDSAIYSPPCSLTVTSSPPIGPRAQGIPSQDPYEQEL
ncbi:uncharacterized protein BDR25DRAFT_352991 [Lindgomyces ingoldianus]|uniref:Uncharacterized protein n=1 Tax=Lindgomyces ingoldianus TaxID=673940 RepID=A0ACB6R053_9PLEO|nr:uncharacterized protein BDR25DRAFT_352991 [Lindgomyces ingoldianus]KAF2472674.1 hypothetical protein BDR25DRAFT_352991 [Lindgomyces ingoldianus]